jgi:uncharacterized OB-fold protein
MTHMTGDDAGPLHDWVLPEVTDLNRAWFTSGELTVQECRSCGAVQHPPEEVCHACGAAAFTSRVVAPTGTVHSCTVVHHAVHPALADAVPYAVVLVALDELPEVRVVGNLLDVPVDEVRIGLAVHATFPERVADDGEVLHLPQWVRRAARS